jgi:phospholipase/carboxylesterase
MWDDSEMNVRTLGSLRARTIVKTSGTTAKNAGTGPLTVVLMHGYGAPGDDLVSMAESIDAPAGTTFVFPQAPLVLSDPMMPFLGDARAWWEIDIGRYERAIRQGTLEELIKDEPAGMASARDAVVAMLVLASTEWLPRMADRKGMRVLQSHGAEDPILPFALAQVLHRALAEAGLETSFLPFEGGHGIPPSVMRALGQWLHALP